MTNHEIIDALRKRLAEELPGYEAQKLMEPPLRKTFELDSSKAKKAATLLILYFEKEWKFILIQRSSHPLDKHKGQISFPGGSIEKGETSDEAALREAEEEIGVKRNQLELIGKLTDLFIPVSNFIVAPYVAFGDISFNSLVKEESEVSEILSIRLADLLSNEHIEKREMKMNNGFVVKDIPVFSIDGHEIWGATAMMLSEFRALLNKIQ